MRQQLWPSMMCVHPAKLEPVVRLFEETGIAGLHVDVMDGHFVPNIQLGTDYCRYLAAMTKLPLDYHLMVTEPEKMIGWFPIREGDLVSVHAESTKHLSRVFDQIIALGAKPMVAINPATPLSMIEEVLPSAAGVLIMTVNPGFAGQKMVPSTLDKIRRTRAMLDECGYAHLPIEVDGNVSPENAIKMQEAGANMFVIGTSGFLKSMDEEEMAAGIKQFRKLLG